MDTETKRQIAALRLRRDRPLLICDVDEVALHFVRGFEAWLSGRGFWLDPESYELEGNVRRKKGGERIGDAELRALLAEFFRLMIGELEPVEGAVAHLARIADEAQIVMLTNLPHVFYERRRANLLRHGMDYPLVTNSGPKGPAVRAMAEMTSETAVFIDDFPDFLESARALHPPVRLVHFLHDPRFAPHARDVDGAVARVSAWPEAARAVLGAFNGKGG